MKQLLAVLGSPHSHGTTAVIKNLFDCLLGIVMEVPYPLPRLRLSGKQEYLILTSCNTHFPFSWLCGQSRGAVRAMDEVLKNSGMKGLGAVVFSGAKGRDTLPPKLSRRIKRYWR